MTKLPKSKRSQTEIDFSVDFWIGITLSLIILVISLLLAGSRNQDLQKNIQVQSSSFQCRQSLLAITNDPLVQQGLSSLQGCAPVTNDLPLESSTLTPSTTIISKEDLKQRLTKFIESLDNTNQQKSFRLEISCNSQTTSPTDFPLFIPQDSSAGSAFASCESIVPIYKKNLNQNDGGISLIKLTLNIIQKQQ